MAASRVLFQEIDGYFLLDEKVSVGDDDDDDSDCCTHSEEEVFLDISDPEIFTQSSSHVTGKSLKRKRC